MIRRATLDDTDKICGLWLEASLRAHNFISEDYWRRMLPGIKRDYLPNSETYVFVDKHQIKGFLSLLDGKHIGALFVTPRYQRAKIGTKLLRYVRRKKPQISLNVFVQNKGAIAFYQKNDFKVIGEQIEPSTKEKELLMCWAIGCKNGFQKRFKGDS